LWSVVVGVAHEARWTFASGLLHGLERRYVLLKDPVVWGCVVRVATAGESVLSHGKWISLPQVGFGQLQSRRFRSDEWQRRLVHVVLSTASISTIHVLVHINSRNTIVSSENVRVSSIVDMHPPSRYDTSPARNTIWHCTGLEAQGWTLQNWSPMLILYWPHYACCW
jgi:hypothetical protein